MEVKLVQQLDYCKQCPFYGIIFDLKKAYDAMDRERCLEIFEGAGVGLTTLRILKKI